MQKPPDHFLACATFSFDQNRKIVAKCSLNLFPNLAHSSCAPENITGSGQFAPNGLRSDRSHTGLVSHFVYCKNMTNSDLCRGFISGVFSPFLKQFSGSSTSSNRPKTKGV